MTQHEYILFLDEKVESLQIPLPSLLSQDFSKEVGYYNAILAVRKMLMEELERISLLKS